MIRKPRIGTLCAFLAAFVAFSPGAWALGLGNASVESYLNEPLRAKIELILRGDEDLTSVTASLASADDFALIGANREAISVPLRFAIEQTATGTIIAVTSNLPVKDPVIRLIVEVNWASGRMLREYTLFLDPPVFTAPAPSPVIDQRRSATPAAAAQPGAPVSTAPAELQDEPSTAADSLQPEGFESDGSEYGPVQSGDTLWRIASDWSQGSGQDLNAVMLAIQQNNPQAFINDNINLLKRGAILRMPQMSDISQFSEEVARSEVIAQGRAIEQDTMAPAVETPLVSPESVSPSSADASEPESAEDQLELVPPSEVSDADSAYGFEESAAGSTASTAVQTLREELSRKEEELIIEQQENQYLKDRLAELESQVADGQAGTVSDPDLAQMEETLREQRLSEGADETAGTAPTDAAKAEPTPAPVVKAQPRKPKAAWYQSVWAWLAGLVLVVAGAVAWFFSRRRSQNVTMSELGSDDRATVRTIKSEAEKILRVLETDAETTDAVVAKEGGVSAPGVTSFSGRPGKLVDHEEAELLDEDSADPEVRLDLARAYIAMGDREAARAILDEVVEHGSAEQQSEARAMLGEL